MSTVNTSHGDGPGFEGVGPGPTGSRLPVQPPCVDPSPGTQCEPRDGGTVDVGPSSRGEDIILSQVSVTATWVTSLSWGCTPSFSTDEVVGDYVQDTVGSPKDWSP